MQSYLSPFLSSYLSEYARNITKISLKSHNFMLSVEFIQYINYAASYTALIVCAMQAIRWNKIFLNVEIG